MLRSILLMSRPPLLCEEGNVLSHELAKLKLSHYLEPRRVLMQVDHAAKAGTFDSDLRHHRHESLVQLADMIKNSAAQLFHGPRDGR